MSNQQVTTSLLENLIQLSRQKETVCLEQGLLMYSSNQLPRIIIVWLFARFTKIYETRFTEKFVNSADMESSMNEWGEALVGLTDAQIQRGLKTVRLKNHWPPSIAEFYQAAVYFEPDKKTI